MKYKCQYCQDTGYIYFGDETYYQEKIICDCQKKKLKSGDNKNVISRCNNSEWNGKNKR